MAATRLEQLPRDAFSQTLGKLALDPVSTPLNARAMWILARREKEIALGLLVSAEEQRKENRADDQGGDISRARPSALAHEPTPLGF